MSSAGCSKWEFQFRKIYQLKVRNKSLLKTISSGTSRRPEGSLEADVEELEPEPGQRQRQHHGGKGKREPRRKVYHITVLRKQSAENMTNKKHQVKEDGVGG